jgi:hypothetical protein
MSATQRSPRRAASFGPVQLARHLGWFEFQVGRGLRLGLVPAPDLGGRWSAGLVEQFEARAEQVRGEVGSLPDLGATRVAVWLAERFECEVTADAVIELGRREVLPIAAWHKGYPLFDGRAVERFTDRAALADAIVAGRSVAAADAAAHLRIRRADFDHLVRAGLVTPARWVHSAWQRRRDEPEVALYRVSDLDALGSDVAIDWAAVRATPPGRVSPLASLPTATNDGDEEAQP